MFTIRKNDLGVDLCKKGAMTSITVYDLHRSWI